MKLNRMLFKLNFCTKSLLLPFLLSISTASNGNETLNPFNPISYSGGSAAAPVSTGEVHPLQQSEVKEYVLMGIISSDTKKIALVRAQNGGEYFVKVGDLLGNAKGEINNISANGIEVNEKDKIVSLLVRNRSVNNEKN